MATTAQFELYHGAVLSQIIRNPLINLKLIERNDSYGWGAYEVTDNSTTHRIYIKWTSQITNRRKGESVCNFTFNEIDIDKLRSIDISRNLLICLVCSDKEICTLEWGDIDDLRLTLERTPANISVSWGPNTSLHVKCRGLELSRTIPRNRLKTFDWS